VRDNRGLAACDRCGAEIPRGAHFCPHCGAPVSAERPTEERKLATVLFADLVGSTALAGSQDPERTRALLDRFYEGMAQEIERAGGTTEKFAGDESAVWRRRLSVAIMSWSASSTLTGRLPNSDDPACDHPRRCGRREDATRA
jgi:class 3 adenylate cyclase